MTPTPGSSTSGLNSATGPDAADPRVTVLISSFDGFKECWPAVCHGFAKYWPDCPFQILLMTNTVAFEHAGIRAIRVQAGPWSDGMISALSQITSPFILYFQEDYWIRERVNTRAIIEFVDLMQADRLDYLRLLANPRPDRPYKDSKRIGVLNSDALYRTSCQVAFWRTDVLQRLLRPGESAWDFEITGSRRSEPFGSSFLSVWDHEGDDYFYGVRYVCSAINRGRWARMAIEYAEREGIEIDFSTRPVETAWDEFLRTPAGRSLWKWRHRILLLCLNPGKFARIARQRFGRRT